MSASDLRNPACLLCGPGKARYEERPYPEIRDPHDVVVRIAYTGVCGSDVHFWEHGGINVHVSEDRPLVMGHESSGIIYEVGSAVKSLKPGDPVAVEPGYPCRRCVRCKEGRYHLCPDMMFAGNPPHAHGTLTKFFRIPADYCYKLPLGTIGLDEAALIEPLAVAVHANRTVGVRPGDKVVVFGAGTVGLLCAAVAREFGANKVLSVDIIKAKLDFAETFVGNAKRPGFFATAIPDKSLSSEDNAARLLQNPILRDAAEQGGVDVVIDATGAAPCIQTGIHVLRNGGSFIQVGMGTRNINFPIASVCEKELSLKGCFRYGSGDYQLALELATQGKIGVKSLITAVLPFEKAPDAWETTMRGEGIKTLIQGVQD